MRGRTEDDEEDVTELAQGRCGVDDSPRMPAIYDHHHRVRSDEIDFLGLEEVGPNFEERSVARLTDHLAGKETPPEATIVYGLLVQTPDIYIGY